MGPSGVGKTTLLRIMMGLELPDRGEVVGFGGLKKSAVFQEDRLLEGLSAAANVSAACRRPPGAGAVMESLAAVGIGPDSCSQPVRSMSGGQRRRVAIVRALEAEYDALFLDEPFKGLDEATKAMALRYVRARSAGRTVFLVTHDESECVAMGGTVTYLSPPPGAGGCGNVRRAGSGRPWGSKQC